MREQQTRSQRKGPRTQQVSLLLRSPCSTTTNLANVDVGAVAVNLGVVVVEDGRVDIVRGLNSLARVTTLDDVGVLAVFAVVTEAKDLIDLQVGASSIDRRVHSRQLVPMECRVVSAKSQKGE